ncbi:MAG: hypothetical protein KIT31_36315 [Deltaproteobacteria bacterium]|nr:hypothetical protein [Deltaproteobacteria bacterium]
MKRSSYLALLVVAFAIGRPLEAEAAPKVALTPIDGDNKDQDVREAVSEALEGNDLVVIPRKDVNKAVNKIEDLSELTEADAKKIASSLNADAIIHGRLEKGDDGKKLKFVLFVGGKKTKGFSVTFSNAKSPKFKRLLHDKMVAKISSAKAAAAEDDEEPVAKKKKKGGDDEAVAKKKKKGGDDDEEVAPAKKRKGGDEEVVAKKKKKKGGDDDEEVAPAKKKKGGEEAVAKKKKGGDDDEEVAPAKKKKGGDDEAVAKKKKKGGDDDEEVVAKKKKGGDDDDEGGGDDEEATPARSKKVAAGGDDDEGTSVRGGFNNGGTPMDRKRTANRAALRLDAGGSFAKRSLAFTSNLPADQRPKAFNPSPVPGLRLDLEVYPLALSNPFGAAAGLGLAVQYDKTVGFNVGSSAEAIRLPVNQQHLGVAAKYRLLLGKTPTSPAINFGFGFGKRTFIVQNRGALMNPNSLDLPDTDYQFFAPQLGFRVPLAKMVALTAGGEGMLVTNAGPIQRADSYGRAKIVGISGAAGLDIILTSRVGMRLQGEFTRIGFTFVGNGGDLANNRDNDPTDRDVGGAADQSFGGSATLGVIY